MPKAAPSVVLPPDVARELAAYATGTQRSLSFVAWRVLLAAPEAVADDTGGERSVLTRDEDDPPGLDGKLAAALGRRPLDRALVGAWRAARERFQAHLARVASARGAEAADDLDTALADACAPATSA